MSKRWYRLIRRIGRGAFGEVWLAEARGGFPAAVKILFEPLDHAKGQRELRALGVMRRLRHPYLVSLQACWIEEERLHIAMELADGNLSDRLEECRRAGLPGIPQLELTEYVCEAAEALDFLHANKVIHRDIKPANMLLLQGHVKVADFSIARPLSELVTAATVLGTPRYAAPEVWRGEAGAATDQYSLALSYAELRLGRRVLPGGKSMVETMHGHLEATPDLGPLPRPEQEVLRRALAKDPAARFPSCAAFVAALRRVHARDPSGSGGSSHREQGVAMGRCPRCQRELPSTDRRRQTAGKLRSSLLTSGFCCYTNRKYSEMPVSSPSGLASDVDRDLRVL
jgi:serine/threonine protein kinase